MIGQMTPKTASIGFDFTGSFFRVVKTVKDNIITKHMLINGMARSPEFMFVFWNDQVVFGLPVLLTSSDTSPSLVQYTRIKLFFVDSE